MGEGITLTLEASHPQPEKALSVESDGSRMSLGVPDLQGHQTCIQARERELI